MRAVYVPAGGDGGRAGGWKSPPGTGGGDWMLTVYPDGPGPPRTPLTDAELRDLIRQWGRAVREGRGTLRIG